MKFLGDLVLGSCKQVEWRSGNQEHSNDWWAKHIQYCSVQCKLAHTSSAPLAWYAKPCLEGKQFEHIIAWNALVEWEGETNIWGKWEYSSAKYEAVENQFSRTYLLELRNVELGRNHGYANCYLKKSDAGVEWPQGGPPLWKFVVKMAKQSEYISQKTNQIQGNREHFTIGNPRLTSN